MEEKKPEWVTRKGGGGKMYKVVSVGTDTYRIDGGLANSGIGLVSYLPKDDYEPCPPPEEDVTHQLSQNENHIYHDFHRIAIICCPDNYKVSLNPFKVERIF